jgi:hypothetical protein
MKLELNASLGFIHKESIMMHGHTILKSIYDVINQYHHSTQNIFIYSVLHMGWDSSVTIATRYELDGLGIE